MAMVRITKIETNYAVLMNALMVMAYLTVVLSKLVTAERKVCFGVGGFLGG